MTDFDDLYNQMDQGESDPAAGDRAEKFEFLNDGDQIAGVIVHIETGRTSRGDRQFLILDTGEGKRSVPLFNILGDRDGKPGLVREWQPRAGDRIAIRYLGYVEPKSGGGQSYKGYKVICDPDRRPTRAVATSFDEIPLAAGSTQKVTDDTQFDSEGIPIPMAPLGQFS